MNQHLVAEELISIIQLSPIKFQKHILTLQSSPYVVKLLADLLTSNRSHQQLQLAAVGINYVISHRLQQDYTQWPRVWDQFYHNILKHNSIGSIQWRHLLILSRSLQSLMNEFESQFCNLINPIFKDLNFKAKVLVYEAFLYTQTTEQTKYVFFRESIQNFLQQILEFICNNHESREYSKENVNFQESILQKIYKIMKSLEIKYENDNLSILKQKLSQNAMLFYIIAQSLLFERRLAYQSVNKVQFSPEQMNKLVLLPTRQTSAQQSIATIKSFALKILTSCITSYDYKSQIEEFDHHKYLFFMEKLTPMVIQSLKCIANKLNYQQNQEIIVSMLEFLTISSKFNFLMQLYDQKFRMIYFQICTPLLRILDSEVQDFKDNYTQFIKVTEQLAEKTSQQKTNTIKSMTGTFLEALVKQIHGSLLFVVQCCVQSIRFTLLSQHNPMIQEAIEQHHYKPSIQSSLLILTIFASEYEQREDLISIIKQSLFNIENITALIGIDRARFLLLLTYTFEIFYQKEPSEGQRFLIFADENLDNADATSICSVMLFQNCFKLGFGNDIWENLLCRVLETSNLRILKLIKKIVRDMLQHLPINKLKDLIGKVIQRLIKEFQESSKQSIQNKIMGNEYFFKCLDIIEQIAEDQKYLKQQGEVIEFIWPVFDLLEFSRKIEFEDNILIIFNKIIKIQDHINGKHFKFIEYFDDIYKKYNGFGNLLTTYSLFLTKGRQHFMTSEEGVSDLGRLMFYLKQTYGEHTSEDTLKHILIFYHYIYHEYSSIIQKDEEFEINLVEIYNQQKSFLSSQTIAAIINFIIISYCKFRSSDVDIIRQNRIQVFRGYQAKLFANGLRNLIQLYSETQRLLQFLKYSIRLLHFVRQTNLAHAREKAYYMPDFSELQKLDPFGQICEALDFIKKQLEPKRYDIVLEQLAGEISLGEIKDLLSRRLVDRNLRIIKKVKKYD